MKKNSAGTRNSLNRSIRTGVVTGYGPSSNVNTASRCRAGWENVSRTSSHMRAAIEAAGGLTISVAGVVGGTMTGTSSSCAWCIQRRATMTVTIAIAMTAAQRHALLNAIVLAHDDLDVAAFHGSRGRLDVSHRHIFCDHGEDRLIRPDDRGVRRAEALRIAGLDHREAFLTQRVGHRGRGARPAGPVLDLHSHGRRVERTIETDDEIFVHDLRGCLRLQIEHRLAIGVADVGWYLTRVHHLRGDVAEGVCEREHLVVWHVGANILCHDRKKLRHVQRDRWVFEPRGEDLHDLPLPAHAAEIALFVVTIAYIADRLITVQVLIAFFQVHMEVAPAVVVVHVFFDVHVQAADRVDEILRGVDLQHHVVVEDGRAKVLHKRRFGALRAAIGDRFVEFAVSGFRYVQPEVARNREHADILALEIDRDRDVRVGPREGGVHFVVPGPIVVFAEDEHAQFRFSKYLREIRLEEARKRFAAAVAHESRESGADQHDETRGHRDRDRALASRRRPCGRGSGYVCGDVMID